MILRVVGQQSGGDVRSLDFELRSSILANMVG
jgi:hypothetical protein